MVGCGQLGKPAHDGRALPWIGKGFTQRLQLDDEAVTLLFRSFSEATALPAVFAGKRHHGSRALVGGNDALALFPLDLQQR